MLFIGISIMVPSSQADGGASVVVVTYLKVEAANFARQAADGWEVSYGPKVSENGDFEMTFKNEIRYGPGGIGKETWWVDVNGNLNTGAFGVKGRGSDIIGWVNWYEGGLKNKIGSWMDEWKRANSNPGGGKTSPTNPHPLPAVPIDFWQVEYRSKNELIKDRYFEANNNQWRRALISIDINTNKETVKEAYVVQKVPSRNPGNVRLHDPRFDQFVELSKTSMDIYRVKQDRIDKNVFHSSTSKITTNDK